MNLLEQVLSVSAYFPLNNAERNSQIPKYRSHFTLWCAKLHTETRASAEHRACNSSHNSCCQASQQRCLQMGQLQWLLFCIDYNNVQHSNMHWSSIFYDMQLKTVSNGLVRTCSEGELAFFCTQLILNLRNSARATTQTDLPSSSAHICEWIKNHFAIGSPETERLYNTTDC